MVDKANKQTPPPPHPVHRREKFPWQTPKSSQEDLDALARIERLLQSPGYRRADEEVKALAGVLQENEVMNGEEVRTLVRKQGHQA